MVRIISFLIGIVMAGSIVFAQVSNNDKVQLDKVDKEQIYSEQEKELIESDKGIKAKGKVAVKKITDVSDAAGNAVLTGVDKVGDWISEKSGDRIETKWNPQREDDKDLAPEHRGLIKDPALGT